MSMVEHRLTCDGWCDGANPVAMIGNKGYAYCAPCGVSRRESGYENVRKCRPAELKKLQRGEALARY